jgi:ABC-type glycerol-3-phosphate transport system substrate-binding protein
MDNLDLQISEEKLDKILKNYFDVFFKGAYISTNEKNWYGIFNQDGNLLVGRPIDSNTDIMYYDGTTFKSLKIFFDLTIKGFSDALKRYIEKTYNIKVRILM